MKSLENFLLYSVRGQRQTDRTLAKTSPPSRTFPLHSTTVGISIHASLELLFVWFVALAAFLRVTLHFSIYE